MNDRRPNFPRSARSCRSSSSPSARMALLMIGVVRRRALGAALVNALAIVGPRRSRAGRGPRRRRASGATFERRLRGRRLCALHEGRWRSSARPSRSCSPGASARARGFDALRVPVLILLGTLGMLVMISANDLISLYLGLELQSLAALRRRRDPPRRCALDRSGAEIFRPRRALLRHAALRRLAGLWLHRPHRLRADRRGARRRAARSA